MLQAGGSYSTERGRITAAGERNENCWRDIYEQIREDDTQYTRRRARLSWDHDQLPHRTGKKSRVYIHCYRVKMRGNRTRYEYSHPAELRMNEVRKYSIILPDSIPGPPRQLVMNMVCDFLQQCLTPCVLEQNRGRVRVSQGS